MTVRIINEACVTQCLTMAACIDLMDEVHIALSNGETKLFERSFLPLITERDSFGVMPGQIASSGIFGAKLLSLFPGNTSLQQPTIMGAIVLFEQQHGAPVALINAAPITALRTAATSASATRALARRDASVLTLLGCGVQAVSHLDAMLAVRPVREVRVWARSADKARLFAEQQGARLGITLQVMTDARQAIEGADLICAVTGATEPVIAGDWLQPGAHINLVGAHTPTTREADSNTMRRARIYVEMRANALAEAGDLMIPLQAGDIDQTAIIGELGQVLAAAAPGRLRDDDITVYKSLGNVAQDLAAAERVYTSACARDLGQLADF